MNYKHNAHRAATIVWEAKYLLNRHAASATWRFQRLSVLKVFLKVIYFSKPA